MTFKFEIILLTKKKYIFYHNCGIRWSHKAINLCMDLCACQGKLVWKSGCCQCHKPVRFTLAKLSKGTSRYSVGPMLPKELPKDNVGPSCLKTTGFKSVLGLPVLPTSRRRNHECKLNSIFLEKNMRTETTQLNGQITWKTN